MLFFCLASFTPPLWSATQMELPPPTAPLKVSTIWVVFILIFQTHTPTNQPEKRGKAPMRVLFAVVLSRWCVFACCSYWTGCPPIAPPPFKDNKYYNWLASCFWLRCQQWQAAAQTEVWDCTISLFSLSLFFSSFAFSPALLAPLFAVTVSPSQAPLFKCRWLTGGLYPCNITRRTFRLPLGAFIHWSN